MDGANILVRDVPAAYFWDRQGMRREGVRTELLGRIGAFML
jgi:hypothetical protein